MNIFALDADPARCARYHCDAHVLKMTLESAQMLCTVCHRYGVPAPYRPAHPHHPCTLWAGESLSNWRWLRTLALALGREYTFRFGDGKLHRSAVVAGSLLPPPVPERGLTPFAQAMPERFRVPGDPVKAYRLYYAMEKREFAVWTRRRPPKWFTGMAVSRNG